MKPTYTIHLDLLNLLVELLKRLLAGLDVSNKPTLLHPQAIVIN